MTDSKPHGNLSGNPQGRMGSALFRVAILTLVLFVGIVSDPRIGMTQGFYGSITGSVVDSAGGLIADVNVEMTNSGTGVKAQTATNSAGVYSFPNLQPGTYQLTLLRADSKQHQGDQLMCKLPRM
jgi:hypothetical protein